MAPSGNLNGPEYLVDDVLEPNDSTRQKQLFSGTGLLRICLDKQRLVLRTWALVLLLAMVYLFVRTPRYESTTSLMPPDNAGGASSLLGLLSSAPGAAAATASGLLPGIKTPGAVFVGVLQSRSVQQSVVDRYNLEAYYRLKLSEDACRRLSQSTTVAENVKNGIVSITVADRDPQQAAKLASAYVEELDRIMTQNSTSSARRERIFLEGRLKQIKEDLDSSARALSAFSSKNRMLDIPTQGKAMLEAGMHLKADRAAAKSELAGLRQTYSPENARVRGAEARIGELDRQIALINGNPHDAENPGGTDYPSITALPNLAVTYADLQRRAAVNEALWGALTKQYETAKVQEAKEIPTVRILDPAAIPQRKANTSKALVLILGFFAGALLGILSAIARKWWQSLGEQDERKVLARRLLHPFRAS